MSIARRTATGAAIVTMAAGSLISAGVVGASGAGAAPAKHTHCRLKHGDNYPPGRCFIEFDKGKYKRGAKVSFVSRDYKGGATVHEFLSCKNFSDNVGKTDAGSGGKVSDSFRLADKIKKTKCTLTLSGGGSTVEGHFKVKKHS